jgi:hypothetical protein
VIYNINPSSSENKHEAQRPSAAIVDVNPSASSEPGTSPLNLPDKCVSAATASRPDEDAQWDDASKQAGDQRVRYNEVRAEVRVDESQRGAHDLLVCEWRERLRDILCCLSRALGVHGGMRSR